MKLWSPRTTVVGALVVMAVAAAVPTMAAVGGGAEALAWYRDADADGYGDWYAIAWAANQPAGYVKKNIDCDDANAKVFPGSTQLDEGGPGFPEDADCDGVPYEDPVFGYAEDRDRDGYPGDYSAGFLTRRQAIQIAKARNINLIPGRLGMARDCNDSDPAIRHRYGKCYNSAPAIPLDADGDGTKAMYDGGADCDDFDADNFPGNVERLNDGGKDNDCNLDTGGLFLLDANAGDPRRAVPLGVRLGKQVTRQMPRVVRPDSTS